MRGQLHRTEEKLNIANKGLTLIKEVIIKNTLVT